MHRPRYDDWTLPKGRLRGDETDEACALREVEEETGLRCELRFELPSTSYRDARDRAKRVRYWAMRPLDGWFRPRTRSTRSAGSRRAAARESAELRPRPPVLRGVRPRRLAAAPARPPRAGGPAREWGGDDRLRPLDARGRRQAELLVEQLEGHAVERIVSSPFPAACRPSSRSPRRAAFGSRRSRSSRRARARGLDRFPAARRRRLCVHGDSSRRSRRTLRRARRRSSSPAGRARSDRDAAAARLGGQVAASSRARAARARRPRGGRRGRPRSGTPSRLVHLREDQRAGREDGGPPPRDAVRSATSSDGAARDDSKGLRRACRRRASARRCGRARGPCRRSRARGPGAAGRAPEGADEPPRAASSSPRRRVGREEAPREAQRADVDRAHPARRRAAPDRDLGRAAAGVAHRDGPPGSRRGDRARVAQVPLVLGREQPDEGAGRAEDRLRELGAVRRLAAGRGQQHGDLGGAELPRAGDLALGGGDRLRHALRDSSPGRSTSAPRPTRSRSSRIARSPPPRRSATSSRTVLEPTSTIPTRIGLILPVRADINAARGTGP